jgi:hypothetical protein
MKEGMKESSKELSFLFTKRYARDDTGHDI